MNHRALSLCLAGFLILLGGCASTLSTSKKTSPIQGAILLAPYVNSTDDEHAGTALTEITGTTLMQNGYDVYNVDQNKIAEDDTLPDLKQQASEKNATYIVRGVVYEYRYKTDLDGDPAVGITLRVEHAQTGKLVWQGSSSQVGIGFSSLSSAAQEAVSDLVKKLSHASSKSK